MCQSCSVKGLRGALQHERPCLVLWQVDQADASAALHLDGLERLSLCEAPARFSRTAVFGPTVEVLRLTSLHPDLLVACCLT